MSFRITYRICGSWKSLTRRGAAMSFSCTSGRNSVDEAWGSARSAVGQADAARPRLLNEAEPATIHIHQRLVAWSHVLVQQHISCTVLRRPFCDGAAHPPATRDVESGG